MFSGLKERIFIYLFRLLCVCIFLYQGFNISEEYFQEKTGTQISQTSQKDFPKPQFCISVPMLNYYENVLNRNDLSFEEYKNGKWVPDGSRLSAENIFENISPNFTDIVSHLEIDFQVVDEGNFSKIDHSFKLYPV